jgi:hypothetical protein
MPVTSLLLMTYAGLLMSCCLIGYLRRPARESVRGIVR